MRMTAAIFATFFLTGSAFADQTDNVVAVDSLNVKERIKSIEQINVTADKALVDIAPDSERVAEFLDTLEETPDSVRTDAHHAASGTQSD